ncbi:tRNA (guanine-N(7)-)-methyltransferase [Tepiditoga spiralis]|uniref:tRNA (guanine-N(7)-)-methyltransferase n=1 Tax=Tepiditoga spiralis TaxID=2108365 RepID=A0A7G1G471_9BACT|nr:tRNA (guanosine(46)-N7)-methyltransferase TrmB [Tepiditoga spiralis]BBE31290.1 tRNA (guanine-N(7)-)-methyltransferase [Tepiditoga spiralis]
MKYLKYSIDPRKEKNVPINWEKIFEKKGELYVEIGFGGGEYMAEMAKKNPEANFIGFETSLTACDRAQKKFYNYNLNNVKIINHDARFCIRELFADNTISKIIVNFPCPWPKKKHESRRIFVEKFRKTLSSVLMINGSMELATDVEWYAKEVYENFKLDDHFEVEEIVENFNRPIKTRYEKKWEEDNRNKYLVKIKKIKNGNENRIILEENDMPHRHIKDINIEKITELLNKKFQFENETFVIREIFESKIKERYVLKVFTSDDDFTQDFFVNIVKREEEWLIKLEQITTPYRTPAVKYAINKIAEEIEVK